MPGKVTLVGAGPGDPGLLTRKGLEALQKADVVVYDRLVSPEILALMPEGAQQIDVGKQAARHPVPQEEINRILLEKAQAGHNVVRLKGGDPFLFGRGGEELELLAEHGVAFEEVPGITSAIAAPAYAGIPVTHRDCCSSLHIVTGHQRAGKEPSWPAFWGRAWTGAPPPPWWSGAPPPPSGGSPPPWGTDCFFGPPGRGPIGLRSFVRHRYFCLRVLAAPLRRRLGGLSRCHHPDILFYDKYTERSSGWQELSAFLPFPTIFPLPGALFPVDLPNCSPLAGEVKSALGLGPNTFVGLTAGRKGAAQKTAGVLRSKLGALCPNHMDRERYEFCWIVDFPMYEIGEESGELEFCHNPFSMPNGGAEILDRAIRGEIDPLTITAFQYDLVCNGVELSSGAVRNHDPEIMIKAFELVRLGEEDVKAKFPAMYNAFTYGAPPHAGIAPGVDRMVMLLAGEDSIREIIPFPMNKNAQDVMMSAPSAVTQKQLDELHIAIVRDEA